MRGAVRWLACITLILCAHAGAQIIDATHIGTPLDLSQQTWRFTASDDPRYANPAFDDSQWKPIWPRKTFKEQGYAVPTGLFWARLHVHLLPETNLAMTLTEQSHQVFVNGKLIGQKGGFPDHPNVSYEVEQLYSVPAEAASGHSTVIAFRLWWSPDSDQVDLALSDGAILLGDQTILRDVVRRHRYSRFFDLFIGDIARGIFAFMVGIWALALFRTQPEHREYLWLAAIGLDDAVWACFTVPTQVSQVPIWEA